MTVRFSKGKWEFSENDVYNLDMVFTPFLIAGLTKFIAVGTKGVPSELLSEMFPDVDLFKSAYTEEQLNLADKEFIRRIHCMIYALKNEDTSFSASDITLKDFKVVSGDTVKFEKLSKDHAAKVKKGLQYFAQHYHSLWQ